MTGKSLYINEIIIDKVRHLKNINIKLNDNKRKHIIFTGKNGSGKTSVLEALESYLTIFTLSDASIFITMPKNKNFHYNATFQILDHAGSKVQDLEYQKNITEVLNAYNKFYKGLSVEFTSMAKVIEEYSNGKFIFAYFPANRTYQAEEVKHVEKIVLKDKYKIQDEPGKQLVKYLLDLKTTEALARTSGQNERADEINKWFINFQDILRSIFEDDKLLLQFDIETFKFSIIESGREPFDFNTLPSGYAAVVDIIVGIMLRMEKHVKGFYNIPGVVLIDEIETHLHIELQKKILPLLAGMFPNIQFIVTTHSPFILTSINDAVVYDLENGILVEEGMENLSYEGVVEGYFGSETISKELKEKFERYKVLATKEVLSDSDYNEIAELEFYLDEIPNYLVLNITTEYERLKLEFWGRMGHGEG